MKKIISIFSIVFFLLISFSCETNFLDKAPGVDLTEDNVFLTKANLESFMTTIYRYGMHSIFRYGQQGNIPFSQVNNTDCIHPSTSMSDEGDASEAPFVHSNRWNEGLILPTTIVGLEDFRYYIRWIALRQIALVIARANEVPDADEAYKKQVIAEVKFLRAMNYLEMLKRYGGVPIVDRTFEPAEQINVPRSSVEDCVKFILKDLNEAIPDLPPSYSASLVGRATALAALTVKAKALLLAASPQFNTATPYLSMANSANNKLVCYGNYDVNRWKLAADAAKEALDYAIANGYGLIDDAANRNPKELDNGTLGPLGNYRVAWETYNNKEFILSHQYTSIAGGVTSVGETPLTYFNPRCYGSFWSGISVPLNFLKKYEDTLGRAVPWEAEGGNNLIAKYRSLDPRFKQSISYTNSYQTQSNPIAQIYNGGKDYVNCFGGTWLRKYIPRNSGSGRVVVNDPILRVNEIYLYYAEALNEFSGPVPEAYTAVNTIRARSAMPPFPPGMSQDQFRQKLRNEIAIELLGDDHRFWDLRRWLIADADGVMKGQFQGLQITRVGTSPNFTYTWKPYTFETRTFTPKLYLHPFPQVEVLKGNLTQNPGW